MEQEILTKEFETLEELEKNNIKKSARYNFLKKLLQKTSEIAELQNKIKVDKDFLYNEPNQDMKTLWTDEIAALELELEIKQSSLLDSITSKEPVCVILEIRAGQGGDEASIFAQDLANMYAKLCKKKNWTFSELSCSYCQNLGIKEGIFEIVGCNADRYLESENGVHCVKRVPQTEKKGRIHTSTATVAILPEPKDVEINFNKNDCKIDVFRASGPGGQSVNTTDSAIRITHIPTGITVSQQDEKSQHKNKEKGFKILKARIYEYMRQIEFEKISKQRKNMVGKGQRNERIRTYHFVQNYVSDVRLDNTCHDIMNFMEGAALEKFLDQLAWLYI